MMKMNMMRRTKARTGMFIAARKRMMMIMMKMRKKTKMSMLMQAMRMMRTWRKEIIIITRAAAVVHAPAADLVETGEEAMVTPIHPAAGLQRWTLKKEGG
jgi:hypothetical protein